MKSLTVEELKEIQLKILDALVDFCDKKGIRYFLSYGTLIGAVRHKGYIPWDDDIDIAMLREDYERFVAEFNDYSDLFKVYSIKDTPWFSYPFAKVAYEKSVFMELSDNLKHSIGVNIDVFPVDGIPDDANMQSKFIKKLNRYQNFLNIKAIVITPKRAFYKNAILFIGKLLLKGMSPKSISEKIEKTAVAKEYDYSEKVANIVFGDSFREIVPRKVFEETIYLDFESKKYAAPAGYHEWLTNIYGDYMQLPKEEDRASHHRFEAYYK